MKKKNKNWNLQDPQNYKIKIEVLLLYATVRLKKNGTLNLEKIWRKDLRKKRKRKETEKQRSFKGIAEQSKEALNKEGW